MCKVGSLKTKSDLVILTGVTQRDTTTHGSPIRPATRSTSSSTRVITHHESYSNSPSPLAAATAPLISSASHDELFALSAVEHSESTTTERVFVPDDRPCRVLGPHCAGPHSAHVRTISIMSLSVYCSWEGAMLFWVHRLEAPTRLRIRSCLHPIVQRLYTVVPRGL